MVIDEGVRNRGLKTLLLGFCEGWVRNFGIKSIHVASRPSSLNFYIKSVYVKMPFEDPKESKDEHTFDSQDISGG